MNKLGFSSLSGKDSVLGAALSLFLLLLSVFGIYEQNPPKAMPSDAPPDQFSSARAMKYLGTIGREAHPMGSAKHAEVRDYLLRELAAMGEPQVQTASVVNNMQSSPYIAGTVSNIILRLKGTGTGKAVMLVGHYDSMLGSPGAGDDGSAVAAMLETLRALKSGPPLKNDVLFLFTDGEEAGLLGSKAFVDQSPLVKDVGVALNFEARGSSGPVIMFETSRANQWLIKGFSKAAPHPVANSLAYAVYRLLPNETDFTVFRLAGLRGLNFAYINGFTHYHTRLDSIENVSERSLQHEGASALALTRYFGNLDLTGKDQGNATYFDIFGTTLIYYPMAWVLPLAVLIALIFIAVLILGLKKGHLTPGGLGLGFLASLAGIVGTCLIVTLVWRAVMLSQAGAAGHEQSEPLNNGYYMVAMVALAMAVASLLNILFARRISIQNLTAGGLLWWLILMLLTSLYMPGASYLFAWPLLFSAIAIGWVFYSRGREQEPALLKLSALFLLSCIPALVLAAPLFSLIFTALTLNWIGVLLIIVNLFLGVILLHVLNLIALKKKWLLAGALLAVSLILMVAGYATSRYSRTAPKPDTIFYGLDAGTGKAVWGSSDDKPDQWTSQFLPANAGRDRLDAFFPWSQTKFITAQAPVLPLAAPEARLLEDNSNNGVRTLRLHLTSPRQAPILSVFIDPSVKISKFKLGEQEIEPSSKPARAERDDAWRLVYHALPAEGIDLTLETRSSQPFKVHLLDRSYDLPTSPDAPFKPRPDYMMPSQYPYSDTTMVSKTFTF